RTGTGGGAGRRLREGGREGRVEGDVPLDLVQHLVNAPVEHRDGTEPFQEAQRLLGVVGAPTPPRIDRPERHVRVDDDARAAREPGAVPLQAADLLLPEGAQTAGLEIEDVDQTDEVDTVVVEALPPLTDRALAIAIEVRLAVVGGDVVLAWNVEHAVRLGG